MVVNVLENPITGFTIEQVYQDGIARSRKYGVNGSNLNLETIEKRLADRLVRFLPVSRTGGALCQCLEVGEVTDSVLVN